MLTVHLYEFMLVMKALICIQFPVLQWLPLPGFLLYRLIVFGYLAAWIIAHGAIRSDSTGVYWFIYITDWAFLLLVITLGAAAVVSFGYYMMYYVMEGGILDKCFPKEVDSPALLYCQDNIHSIIKVFWFTYIVATTTMVMVGIAYWPFVYDPDCSGEDSEQAHNASQSMENNSMEDTTSDSCGLDVASIHAHGVTFVIVFVDLTLSRIPFHLLHFPYTCVFSTIFVIFSAVYFAAGGIDEFGNPYIYETLDYEGSPAVSGVAAVCLCLVPAVIYLIPFVVALLRDVVHRRLLNTFYFPKRTYNTTANRDSSPVPIDRIAASSPFKIIGNGSTPSVLLYKSTLV